MKTLVLIRHAKSSWKDMSLDDYDRPLNKRGKENAPLIGKILKQLVKEPDRIITSGAKRAKKTAKAIKEELCFTKDFIIDDDIYYLDEDYILETLKELKKEEVVFIVGHNPTLNSLAEDLVDFDENITTASFIQIEFDVKKWSNISPLNASLIRFEYPKKYL